MSTIEKKWLAKLHAEASARAGRASHDALVSQMCFSLRRPSHKGESETLGDAAAEPEFFPRT